MPGYRARFAIVALAVVVAGCTGAADEVTPASGAPAGDGPDAAVPSAPAVPEGVNVTVLPDQVAETVAATGCVLPYGIFFVPHRAAAAYVPEPLVVPPFTAESGLATLLAVTQRCDDHAIDGRSVGTGSWFALLIVVSPPDAWNDGGANHLYALRFGATEPVLSDVLEDWGFSDTLANTVIVESRTTDGVRTYHGAALASDLTFDIAVATGPEDVRQNFVARIFNNGGPNGTMQAVDIDFAESVAAGMPGENPGSALLALTQGYEDLRPTPAPDVPGLGLVVTGPQSLTRVDLPAL